jgi:hypothetical protein
LIKDISSGAPPPEEKILAEFDKYDVNGDETVDIQEFKILVCGIFTDLMERKRVDIWNKMNQKRLKCTTYSSPESFYY